MAEGVEHRRQLLRLDRGAAPHDSRDAAHSGLRRPNPRSENSALGRRCRALAEVYAADDVKEKFEARLDSVAVAGLPIGVKLSGQHIERNPEAKLAIGADHDILDDQTTSNRDMAHLTGIAYDGVYLE
jgi:hypothetical protein